MVANVRGIQVMSVAAAVVLVGYVVGGVVGADLGSATTIVRIVVLAAAAIVAVMTFQAFSHGSTPHTLSAMIVGLLGGASLASTITTAKGDAVYGSDPLALVGTVAIVAAVTIAHIGQTRAPKEDAR